LPRYSYSYKTLNSLVGKAIHRYDMIGNGDRIAVGLSGGKDSLMLLWALAERRKRVPVHYDLYPIYVDPGFEGGFGEALADTCQQFGFPSPSTLPTTALSHTVPPTGRTPVFSVRGFGVNGFSKLPIAWGVPNWHWGTTKTISLKHFFSTYVMPGKSAPWCPGSRFSTTGSL
jgi:hypothetical protein